VVAVGIARRGRYLRRPPARIGWAPADASRPGVFCDPMIEGAGTRTQDPRLKRPLLCLLSYALADPAHNSSLLHLLLNAGCISRQIRRTRVRPARRYVHRVYGAGSRPMPDRKGPAVRIALRGSRPRHKFAGEAAQSRVRCVLVAQ
jgi:hypothetical protein